MNEFEEEPNDGYYPDAGGDVYAPDPYSNSSQIDAELISSGYKDQKISISVPKYKQIRVTSIVRNSNGTAKLLNGKPVEKDVYMANVFEGYETKEIELPIKNIHNNSVTSSILTDSDVEMIRLIDDLFYDLSLDTALKPDVSFVKTLVRLYGLKASIVDSSKGRWGRSAELAKTQITKGESKTVAYHDQKGFEEYEQRKNRKGIFGFGTKFF